LQHTIGLAVIWGLGLQTWAMNSVLMSWGLRDRPINRRRAALLPLLILFFAPGPFIDHVYKAWWTSTSSRSSGGA
jgi:hypothetical protein